MKQKFRTGALLLALLTLFSFAACAKKSGASEQTTAASEQLKSADEYGVTVYGLIHESAFPNHRDLETWYKNSEERTSLVYAVFYAQDQNSNLWYCWMYVEGYTYVDTAEIKVDDTNGTLVQINISLQNEDATTPGAICFALPSDAEPSFALSVNGVPEGLIVTLTDTPAIPLA